MKVRFDGLDVTAMVAVVHRTLVGRRILNIYNDGGTFVLKLDGDTKSFLLLESGIRFHPIQFFQTDGNNAIMPSPICMKFRKHLRGLRLEWVKQIGTDRVVLFQFGAGPSKHALILELYAKGNIILTDSEYKILSVLRSHVYEEKVAVKVGQVYPVTYATSEKLQDKNAEGVLSMQSGKELKEWFHQEIQNSTSAGGKKGKKASPTLKTLLLKPTSGVTEFGPALIEHCILSAELEPHKPIPDLGMFGVDDFEKLLTQLREEGPGVMKALLNSATTAAPGYVLYQERQTDNPISDPSLPHADKILEEFLPHLLKQHEDRPRIVYEHFGEAVADFFSRLETQKRMLKAQAAEVAAKEKLEKVKNDQIERVKGLEREQEELKLQATVVQMNADDVEKALTVINSALDCGMDWDQLEQLVDVEQQNGNPVAKLIHKLDLENDSMVLRLKNALIDDNAEEVDVRISLKESAHANANALFEKYRLAKEKAKKTVEASSLALKAAEENAKKQVAAAQKKNKQTTTMIKRKPSWFEKFHWFVTSDNYLVLGGKDAHQNELLVKRYLRPGDAYLHADVHGASSCILRAKRRRTSSGKTEALPLSEQALREAGSFTICRSSAWTSRMVTSAWWVESHQVSKTAPTGEYLTVGSFMVRGKKNFLPPSQLEMGLAVMFRLGDDESIARHKNDRRDFALLELESSLDNDQEEESQNYSVMRESQREKTTTNKQAKQIPAEAFNVEEGGEVERVDDKGEHNDPTTEQEPSNGKKNGISARDRRQIKKFGSAEQAKHVRFSDPKEGDASDSSSANSTTNHLQQRNLKRGKRSKMKRAMRKYKDQDEEDRELAILALQGGEKPKENKKKGSKQQQSPSEKQVEVAEETIKLLVKDSSTVASKLPDQVRSILEDCMRVDSNGSNVKGSEVAWEKLDADIVEQLAELSPENAQLAAVKRLRLLKSTTTIENFSASLGGVIRTIKKYGYETFLIEEKAETRASPQVADSKIENEIIDGVDGSDDDDDEGDIDDRPELSKLTGKPLTDDLLLSALPVCAPYAALSQYTFRVKLTPGNLKRGKASKQCVEMFLQNNGKKLAPSEDRLRTLIRNVADTEWVHVLCADVKISSAGAQKIVKAQKGNKKR